MKNLALKIVLGTIVIFAVVSITMILTNTLHFNGTVRVIEGDSVTFEKTFKINCDNDSL